MFASFDFFCIVWLKTDYSWLHIEVLNIIVLIDVSGDFSMKKK